MWYCCNCWCQAHTCLQVQSHTALVQAGSWISISHFPMPQQVSVSLHIVGEVMTHRNPHGKKRLLRHGQLRLCREMWYRWAGTLEAPGDVMLSAHLWPKAWLKGSKNTSPWPNVGNCFHLPFLADSLSLLNVDNILYKFPCNSLFQKLSPVI